MDRYDFQTPLDHTDLLSLAEIPSSSLSRDCKESTPVNGANTSSLITYLLLAIYVITSSLKKLPKSQGAAKRNRKRETGNGQKLSTLY